MFVGVLLSSFSLTLQASTIDQMLENALNKRLTDKAEFALALDQLEARKASFTPPQRYAFEYLQAVYDYRSGDIASAVTRYKGLVQQSTDLKTQYRALVSLANIYSLKGDAEQAFALADRFLAPKYHDLDFDIKQHAYIVLAYIYLQGELIPEAEEALLLVDESSLPESEMCVFASTRIGIAFKAGGMNPDDYDEKADVCLSLDQDIFLYVASLYKVQAYLSNGSLIQARAILERYEAGIARIQYSNLSAVFYALKARVALLEGNLEYAESFGLTALNYANMGSYLEAHVLVHGVLADIYFELDSLTEMRHHMLAYDGAFKSQINATRSSAIAYYTVKLLSQQKQFQIEELNKQMATIKLEAELAEVEVENRRLYLVLLVVCTACIGLWSLKNQSAKRRLKRMVEVDELTQVYSRAYGTRLISSTLKHYKSAGQDVGLLLIDLDHFKSINDSFGHGVGDWALKEAARTIKSVARKVDIVTRYGGEEFCVLLPSCSHESAMQVAEKCRAALAAIDTEMSGFNFSIRGSIGLAVASEAGYSFKALFDSADSALYRAKSDGRNRVVTA
ncbi:diguanylate cyclase [Corallincola platygyrae]|uniref:diguanylate cyclase n=1 Tax=Corallincola platygyrae TaxID=1193278 RepID=A0ABW4XHM2_9GAMM